VESTGTTRASANAGGSLTDHITMQEWAIIVYFVGIFLTIVLSAGMIWVRLAAVSVEQESSIDHLIQLAQTNRPAGEDEANELRIRFHTATARIFKAFDLDGSGEIDARELRAIMTQMVAPARNSRNHHRVCLTADSHPSVCSRLVSC
jgi:hypothetical protein